MADPNLTLPFGAALAALLLPIALFQAGRALLRRRDPIEAASARLYGAVATLARDPAWFRDLAVPDTVAGRFETLLLGMTLVLDRLTVEGGASAARLRQGVFDRMGFDLDQALRETGVGDTTVGKQLRRFAAAARGRAEAYRASLDAADPAELPASLARNLYAGGAVAPLTLAAIAEWLRAARAALAATPMASLAAGSLPLPPLPQPRPAPQPASGLAA